MDTIDYIKPWIIEAHDCHVSFLEIRTLIDKNDWNMGARSGQNSIYYFCPLSNYFYGVQHLFIYVLKLFLQVYELFVRG